MVVNITKTSQKMEKKKLVKYKKIIQNEKIIKRLLSF